MELLELVKLKLHPIDYDSDPQSIIEQHNFPETIPVLSVR